MENFPHNNTVLPEQIEFDLQKKISFAKAHLLTEQEEKQLSEKEIKLEEILSHRNLTNEEVEYYRSFDEKMNKAIIVVQTLLEARRVMEILGFPEADLVNTLSHENAHVNKGEVLGVNHHGYAFILSKSTNGKIAVHPQSMQSLPDEWNINEKNQVQAQILQAPDEYGNKMSESDKQKLNEIYKK